MSIFDKPRVKTAVDTLLARFEENQYAPTPLLDLAAMIANASGEVDESEAFALGLLAQKVLGESVPVEVVQMLVTASIEVLEVTGLDSRARFVADVLADCDAVEPGVIVAMAVAFASERSPESLRRISTRPESDKDKSPDSSMRRKLKDSELKVVAKICEFARFDEAKIGALEKEIAALA